jgi:hypothetical protein
MLVYAILPPHRRVGMVLAGAMQYLCQLTRGAESVVYSGVLPTIVGTHWGEYTMDRLKNKPLISGNYGTGLA